MADTDVNSLGLHKWLVFVAAVLVTWVNFGFIFTFGAMFLTMLDRFGESRSSTATVHALLMGVTMSCGVIVGLVISKVGLGIPSCLGAVLAPLGLIMAYFTDSILALDICIGVISAIGISLIFISSAVSLGRSFTGPQRLLVLALQNSAISVAGMTYPYLYPLLLDQVGFQGTFLILGGIFLHTIPAALIFTGVAKPILGHTPCANSMFRKRKYVYKVNEGYTKEDNGVKVTSKSQSKEEFNSKQESNGPCVDIQNRDVQQENKLTEPNLEHAEVNAVTVTIEYDAGNIGAANDIKTGEKGLISLAFLCLMIASILIIPVLNGYNTVVLDIFKWKGYTEEQGLFSFLPLNISALISRILPGVVKQRSGFNSLLLPAVFGSCGCLGQVVILLAQSYAVILLGVVLTGVALGGVMSAVSVALVNIVGQDKFPVAFGLLQTVIGLTSAASGPIFGAIWDGTNTYWSVLVITSSLLSVGVVCFLVCMYLRTRP